MLKLKHLNLKLAKTIKKSMGAKEDELELRNNFSLAS
jgi:hypothetical protein